MRRKNVDKTIEKQEKDTVCVENLEQIRLHPYRHLGTICGSSADDAIYVLMDEVLANAFEEVSLGATRIDVDVFYKSGLVIIEDNGHGIPLGKIVEVLSKSSSDGGIGDYYTNSEYVLQHRYKLGIKEVNAMCSYFCVSSYREGRYCGVIFKEGRLCSDDDVREDDYNTGSGTRVSFTPDRKLFGQYHFMEKHVLALIDKYRQLGKNMDLTIIYNAE